MEISVEEIDDIQKRLDRNQTLLEILSLLVVLLLVGSFMADLGIITTILQGLIIVILLVRSLQRLEQGKI